MKKACTLALIAVVVCVLFSFCACDSDSVNDNVSFYDGMSQKDIVENMYVKTLSATFTPTEEGIKAWSAFESLSDILDANVLCEQVKFTENGFSTSTHTVIYEDGKLYQFVDVDGNVDFSVQQVSIEQIKAGEIATKNDNFYDANTISFYLFGLDKDSRVDAVNSLNDKWIFSVENGKIIATANILGLDTKPLFVLSDINSTSLDIPEQYANYKSLELTA